MLDKLVLIACICVVIATVFYLFYWNRLLALLLGFVIRFLYWKQGASSVWVGIGSVQVSLISGRIFLKDVRYHSSNQTIRIVKAQIIWKYWLRRPLTDENIGSMFGADEAIYSKSSPSCRIQVSLQGYECFLYNRTAAFDSILSQMGSQDVPSQHANKSRRSMDTRQSVQTFTPADFGIVQPSYLVGTLRLKTPSALKDFLAWFRRQMPNLDPKELMPIGIDVTKGVITCGNNSTPSLLVAEFESTVGTFGITQSRSKFDLYKQLLTLSFRNVLIHYVENKQFGDTMPAIGDMIRDQADLYDHLASINTYMGYHRFGKLWRKLGLYSFFGKYISSQAAPRHHARPFMRKAKKSLDEGTPIGVDFANVEYAIERKILSTPSLEMSYYADAAGEVPPLHLHSDHAGVDVIGNGDAGPEWGVDLIVRGGYIRYGPWADRQRGELQKVFFPPTFHDVEETNKLLPGDERLWTQLRVFVELRDDTTLHVPFREASKNWQWDGLVDMAHRPKKREHAVIRLGAGDQSSVCYTMPMTAGPKGYEPTLEVHLDTIAVTSSLNDIRLIGAESCRIRCDLPSPLKWNAPRKWEISVSIRQPVLYLLRDHINMFTDLGKDWAAGPPSDFLRFVPTIYQVQLSLHRFELNLYANDHNIIDKPLVRGDNAFVTLRGPSLHLELTIPSNIFRPTVTDIPFVLEVPDASVTLSLPKWHTNALHAPEQGNHIGTLAIRLDGSYRYFAAVGVENTEQLTLNFLLKNVAFKTLGWSIRYFMIIQQNYFGAFTHFSTLYEYLERRSRGLPPGDPDLDKYRPGSSNMMQVVLVLKVENACIILPAGLPGYEKSKSLGPAERFNIGSCLTLDLPELQVYLRLHDYYMDFSLNVATVSGRVLPECPEVVSYALNQASERPMVLIDGIDITANRLFGPLPRTVTYFCVWEIQVGLVKGSLSAADAFIMSSALTAFRLNFADGPNAPAAEYIPPLYPDITFVKITLEGLDIVWKAEESAIHVSLPAGLRMDNNNLGGKFHRTLTSIRAPVVSVKVLGNVTSRHNNWLEAASFTTDVSLDIYTSPAGWRALAGEQLDFVEEQDELTGRAAEMFKALWADRVNVKAYPKHHKGVYVPQPLPARGSLFSARARNRGSKQDYATSPHMSESEDERVSEAERDARLAKRRSEIASPVKEVPEDDDEMSGADESDDDDVSDGDASHSSDWTDADTHISQEHRHYSHFTRHYGCQFIESPSLWDQSPFFLTQDYKIISPLQPDSVQPPSGVSQHMPEDDIEVTIFRLVCRNGVELRATPLVIPIIGHFQDDLEKIPFAPELSVDAMVASCLASVPKSRKTTNDRNIVDIEVSSCHLHLVRRLDGLDQQSTALANIRLSGLHVSGLFQAKIKSFTATFREAGLQLSVVGSALGPHSEILSLNLTGFLLRGRRDDVEIRWNSLTVNVCHDLPEFAFAFVSGLLQDLKELRPVMKRRQQFLLQNNIRVIRGILTSLSEETVVDPLSAIQPSYLIQSGVPHHLRTDALFRFLFHLRDCLWDIQRWDEPDELDLESLIPLLKERLLALDPDSYHLSRLSLLEPLFPELRHFSDALEASTLGYPFSSITISLHQIIVTVLDPALGPASTVVVTDLELSGRVRFLDFIGDQSSGSQLSLNQESRPDIVRRLSVTLSSDSTTFAIHPHLMGFAQNVLRVRNSLRSTTKPPSHTTMLPNFVSITSIELVTLVKTFRVQAIAANLILEFGIDTTQTGTTLMFRLGHDLDLNSSAVCSSIFLRARSLSADHQADAVLAALIFSRGRANTLVHTNSLSGLKVRLTYDLQSFNFSVPRSALRLYRFYQEWRADFIPGIESAMRELVVELKQTPDPSRTSKEPSKSSTNIQINGHVRSFGILLQVMHGTWISWEMRGSTFNLNSSSSPRDTQQVFGIQVASQTFCVSPSADSQDATPNSRVKLDFPSLSVSGRFNGQCIEAIALIEFLDLKVKPSHWDTLMVVQQKFGQDFNDFLSLIQETRNNKRTTSPSSPPSVTSAMKFVISMKIRGLRIGLEGLASTVYLECQDISGGFDTTAERMWFIALSDLALSLASRTSIEAPNAAFNRSRRSAFVILDFKVVCKSPVQGTETGDAIHIRVTKFHAVMQPSSIGQVGDFVDDMQTEMLVRREQRAHELAALKQKTQKIIQSFEVKGQAPVPEDPSAAILGNYNIDLMITNVGVAFPLIHDDQLNLPHYGSRDSHAVRAFLFSISSIQFGTVRGVTGEANMQRFTFQFVNKFRQSVSADFSGETHQTRNRLVYPEMTAFLRTTKSKTSRHVSMKANVSGFILDLDSTVPDYVFSLVDVYRQGKDRMEQLSQPKSTGNLEAAVETTEPIFERPQGTLLTSTFSGSLSFLSGKVRTYSASASKLSRTLKALDPSDDQVLDVGGEVFNLPGVSVWMEYRATPASHKFGPGQESEEESSLLMFKSTVHSSQNTLRPTLLPFFTELVGRVEHRMRQTSPAAPVVVSTPDPAATQTSATREKSSMQISFSLRIDQSRLELTCKPDVNVVAALQWDSGGFVVNVSPGARNVTFTGAVGGLTVGLRHGFLSEDCVSLDARNLAFSVDFSKTDLDHGRAMSTVSLILDTEFLGGVRFSRLQDILCFKAVWLDRIPMFNGRNPAPETKTTSRLATPDASLTLTPPVQQEYSTILLIRIRQIKLDIDLGQSISAIVLDLRDSVLRTKLTESLKELSLSVGDVSVTARGNIAGKVHVADCVFQTIRLAENLNEELESRSRMLELRMTSGPFIIALESEHQKLLHYRAEPLAVEIFDDWSQVHAHHQSLNRPLKLSFTIVGPEIVAAATVGTIPQILSYVNKFRANLEMQREGASRDSKTFRATRAPQPDNPLSAVAEAMIYSARNRVKEVTESGLSYVIRQHMSLRLDLLRLVVFPRSMDDVEAAQFVGRNVRARLDRLVQSGKPSQRDISLSFTGMTISRLSQLGHTVSALQFSNNNDWLTVLMKGASEATIVGLPAMTMHMVSDESKEDGRTVLHYDFDSTFLRMQGMQQFEDIYIALNVGLYSWLAVLRKTLTREMDQVKEASEWMNTLSAPTNISSLRRKGADVMSSLDAPKSAPVSRATMPHTHSPRPASSSTGSFSLPPLPELATLSAGVEPTIDETDAASTSSSRAGVIYRPRQRHIERLNMRQLGEATPNVMHPFFMKKAGFSLEDSLPQYVNEYATAPLEEIMEILLKLYSRQLLDGRTDL